MFGASAESIPDRLLEKRQSVGRPASRPVAVRLYCYHRNLFIPVSTCPSRSVARNEQFLTAAMDSMSNASEVHDELRSQSCGTQTATHIFEVFTENDAVADVTVDEENA